MSPKSKPKTTTKKKWLRYNVTTLLVAISTCSVWLAVHSNRAAKQRKAVAELREIAGRVDIRYDSQSGENRFQAIRDWLTRVVGQDLLARVVSVSIPLNPNVTDATFEHLNAFPKLRHLEFDSERISDTGLRKVHQLSRLETLQLGETRISNEGLRTIRDLCPRLRLLRVNNANIDSDGLAVLKGMKHLEELVLIGTDVDNDGLRYLKDLSTLKLLSLQGTQVTDDGLQHLVGLKNLTFLKLRGTGVTPEGVAFIKRMLPNCSVSAI